MLLECAWKSNFKYYKRCFDNKTKKSFAVENNKKYEWYIENSNGKYEYILNPEIKLEKIESSYNKEGLDKYGYTDPLYGDIRDNYWNKDLYNSNPRIWYIDIETRSGVVSSGFPVPEKSLESVSLIQIYDNYDNTMFVLGLRDWVHQKKYNLEYPVEYIKCEDEIHLFETYFKLFKNMDPLILYAWNGKKFDYPYLINRSKKLGLDISNFSNYGNVEISSKEFQNQIEFKIKTDGHYYLDLMEVYKTFVYKSRSSYSLENISSIELGTTKVSHTEYSAFDDFYTGKYNIPSSPTDAQLNSDIYREAIKGNIEEVKELSHSEFVYYGIVDTYLIKQIDEKLKFTALLIMIADKMGVLINDTMSTVKPWTNFISNRAMVNNKIMPCRKQKDENPSIIGGYVQTPQVGKHKWVISADVNSMYPLLGMVGFNNSPETFIAKHKLPAGLKELVLRYFNDQDEANRLDLPEETWDIVVDELQKNNMSLGINGAVFTRDYRGMIPELVQEIYDTRKDFKKTMFKYEQKGILINELIKNNNFGTNDSLNKYVLQYTKEELVTLNKEKLESLYNECKINESLYEVKQLVNKRLMNALYGALGNSAFPLFNEHMAAAITGNGRFFIRTLARNIENRLQGLIPQNKKYIVYGDTDSVYYHVEPFVNKYLEGNPKSSINETVDWVNLFEQKVIQPVIVQTIDEVARKLNAFNKKSIWAEREIISDSSVFVSKKKYFARVRDSEGTRYPEDSPYVKVMGLEIIKSSTPKWAQKKLKEAIPLFLDSEETDVKKWIKDLKKDFLSVDLLELSSVSGVTSIDYKITDKGVPFGSRAAIIHNNYIKENGLSNKYQNINSGDKTKRLFLRSGNPFNSNIIAFTNDEFINEIKDYIDYDEIFNKNFLKPLEIMGTSLKWNLTQETDTEDW